MVATEENGRFEEVLFDEIGFVIDQNESRGKGKLIVGETCVFHGCHACRLTCYTLPLHV